MDVLSCCGRESKGTRFQTWKKQYEISQLQICNAVVTYRQPLGAKSIVFRLSLILRISAASEMSIFSLGKKSVWKKDTGTVKS